MSRYVYERLSSASAAFLERETTRLLAHSACVLVFDPGPLARADGGVDFAAIRRAIEARLHQVPRLRQKLAWIPLEGHPVWVDDRDFRLDYHLRHTSLPRPGTLERDDRPWVWGLVLILLGVEMWSRRVRPAGAQQPVEQSRVA